MYNVDLNVYKFLCLILYKLFIFDFILFLKFWKWNIFLGIIFNVIEILNVRKIKYIWNFNRIYIINKIESNLIYFIIFIKILLRDLE